MDKEKYLCPCFKVSKTDIKKAIKNGAASFKDVKSMTDVSKRCGHCKCKVKKYVSKKLK